MMISYCKLLISYWAMMYRTVLMVYKPCIYCKIHTANNGYRNGRSRQTHRNTFTRRYVPGKTLWNIIKHHKTSQLKDNTLLFGGAWVCSAVCWGCFCSALLWVYSSTGLFFYSYSSRSLLLLTHSYTGWHSIIPIVPVAARARCKSEQMESTWRHCHQTDILWRR